MAAYRLVYDSRHLQADCQEPGSAPEPYVRQSSMGYLYLYLYLYLGRSLLSTIALLFVCAEYPRQRGGGGPWSQSQSQRTSFEAQSPSRQSAVAGVDQQPRNVVAIHKRTRLTSYSP